jgi:hypothetical protein
LRLLVPILRRTVVHKIGAVTNTFAMLISTANTTILRHLCPAHHI